MRRRKECVGAAADLHNRITFLALGGGKKKELMYSVYLWSCSSVFYHLETSIKSAHWGNESQERGEKNEAASGSNEFLGE